MSGASLSLRTQVLLWGAQRISAAVLAVCVIIHLITIIYAVTRGGPANRTLITPIQIFRLAFENVEFNQAAALSVMFFATVMLIVLVYIKTFADQPGESQ